MGTVIPEGGPLAKDRRAASFSYHELRQYLDAPDIIEFKVSSVKDNIASTIQCDKVFWSVTLL